MKTKVLSPLTAADAAVVKGMIARGDRQSDIAAYFKVNSGRISEINSGMRFNWIEAAPSVLLPPAGPYDVRFGEAA